MGYTPLRRKLTLPIFIAIGSATMAVSLAAYWMARTAAEAELREKFAAIESMIERANFPFNQNVLNMLAHLTGTRWFALSSEGRIAAASQTSSESPGSDLTALKEWETSLPGIGVLSTQARVSSIQVRGASYRGARFQRPFPRGAADQFPIKEIVVVVDEARYNFMVRQSIQGPLMVGLLAISMMTIITFATLRRWTKRVANLQRDVNLIAAGNFRVPIQIDGDDELSCLGRDVATMAEQIDEMWHKFGQLHRQQLLHQISGGLAHNLRNTLTGARMAVELAQRSVVQCQAHSAPHSAFQDILDSLEVAVKQIEQTEQYVSRILVAARGSLQTAKPMTVRECFENMELTLNSIAKHRQRVIQWSLDPQLAHRIVKDGPTLIAAVSNLVWNAMESGKQIQVEGVWDERSQLAKVDVVDDGPGPSDEIADQLFEPFMTTKADGLGLGLALVKRAASSLAGDIAWDRSGGETKFLLSFRSETGSDEL